MKSVAAVNMDDVGQVFKVGQRVELSPASTWWMRGAKYGEITSLGLVDAHVKLENIGPKRLRARLPYTYLKAL